MALREDVAGGGLQFSDPEVPCLQLFDLQATLDDDGVVSIAATDRHDDVFGLPACPESRLGTEDGWDGIYRFRSLDELPIGRMEHVAVFVGEGVIAEVCLVIGAQPLLLIAGELEEAFDGGLLFQRFDESVLVFTDPAATERVSWTTPREGLVEVGPRPGAAD